MASFKDRSGHAWQIDLDAPTVEAIRDEHSVNIVDLDKDPLGPLRNDPMKLVAVVSLLCRDEIAEKKLSPKQFAKLLPAPPDPMLDAIRDALINFFPSGRASHIREVLLKFDQMGAKTDELAAVKMQQLMDDPKVDRVLNAKADRVISQAIEKMGQEAGTKSIADATLSTSSTI